MKRFLLSAAMCLAAAAMSAQHVVTQTFLNPTKDATSEDPGEYIHYIYNANGQLMWKQGARTRYEYQYDSNGRLQQTDTYGFIAYDNRYRLTNTETYEYDSNGKISVKKIRLNVGTSYEALRHYVYSSYDGTEPTAWSEYSSAIDKDHLWYNFKAAITRNAAGLVTKRVITRNDPDESKTKYNDYQTTTYTLAANGDILTESVATVATSGTTTLLYDYYYSDIDGSAVTGLKLKDNGNNTVTVSWNAVSGATKYYVNYDQQKECTGTSFTTEQLGNGEHKFTVRAVVGKDEKRASAPLSIIVRDPGMKPATNVTAGTATKSRIDVTDDNGRPTGERKTVYTIPVSWTLPTGASPIKSIRVHFGREAGDYQSVEPTATSYTLTLEEYNVMDSNKNYIDLPIFVTLVYDSGESEKSNVIGVNVDKGYVTGIDTPVTNNRATTAYDLRGVRLSAPQRGLNIISGKTVIIK